MSASGHSRHFAGLPMTSGLPPEADIVTAGRHVSKVPILLQKSFRGGERKFLDPLMRLAPGDVSHPKSITDLRSGVEMRRSSREVQRSTFARFLGLFDFRLLQQNLPETDIVNYSINSSASWRVAFEMLRFSDFAVFAFSTSSNLVGCSTGRSAGLAPLKIFATIVAVCRQRSARLGP